MDNNIYENEREKDFTENTMQVNMIMPQELIFLLEELFVYILFKYSYIIYL